MALRCPSAVRPATLPLASVRLSTNPPPFRRDGAKKGAKGRGIRYEKRVQEYLLNDFAPMYVPAPWLHFRERFSDSFRWCQPDGLLIDAWKGVITIVEIKYNHTADAWWQLNHLYKPVLSALFPPELWRLEVCEIVKWYDPATVFPEPVRLVNNPLKESTSFRVHIFNS